MISQACENNEMTKMGVEAEFPDWVEFQSTVLQPRITLRDGELCRESKQVKKQLSFGTDEGDDDDNDIEPLRPLQFNRPDDYGGDLDDQRTNQADMDRLMQPCLDFNDDDDDEDEMLTDTALKMSDLDIQVNGVSQGTTDSMLANKGKKTRDWTQDGEEYSMDKYFSNGDIERNTGKHDDDDDDEDDGY